MKDLTHITKEGQPGMVDISHKTITQREAVASGQVIIPKDVLKALKEKNFETKKGSIIQTAIIAATMSVKNTFQTIPLCHQIPISGCRITITDVSHGFDVRCTVKTNGQTGVEMEALHGVSTACLTIYDMCKAASHEIVIQNIQLEKKTGGKSDYEQKA